MCNPLGRGLVPVLVAVALLARTETGWTDPCCVARRCEDRSPTDCGINGGIAGFCFIGLPCGADSCDPGRVADPVDVVGSAAGNDVAWSWTQNVFADSYYTRWVTDKRELVACNAVGLPVPGSVPSTVAAALHVGALPATTGEPRYYCVQAACSGTAGPSGACCLGGGSCLEGVEETACGLLAGGFVPGAACVDDPCIGDVAPCLVGGNVLYLDGDPADWVHPGIDTITDAVFTPFLTPASDPHTVRILVEPTDPTQGLWWDAVLSSAELSLPLATGSYLSAMRHPLEDPGSPGMDISGDGRGCNRILGRFRVYDLDLASGGTLLRSFTVAWEQHCEVGASQLRGCVHFEQ